METGSKPTGTWEIWEKRPVSTRPTSRRSSATRTGTSTRWRLDAVDAVRKPLEDLVGDEEWAISVITVSELLHGVHRASGGVRARRRAVVESLLEEAETLPITAPVARVHAELWSSLVTRGQMMGLHDLWIAATAVAHGFGVVTHNRRDFDRVEGLRVVSS
jgi:tRNA(fMet)-specific endonuclease VapC